MTNESFTLISGKLGPISKPEKTPLEIRPLTIFMGKQGTGKSFLMKTLYFVRSIREIVQYHLSMTIDMGKVDYRLDSVEILIHDLLNNFSAIDQPFFDLSQQFIIAWKNEKSKPFRFGINNSGKFILNKKLVSKIKKAVDRTLRHYTIYPNAIFVPAERIHYPMNNMELPIIHRLYQTIANAFIYRNPPKEAEWLEQRLKPFINNINVWTSNTDSSLSRLSSGQTQCLNLLRLIEILFLLREGKGLSEPFCIFIEEPELGLSQEAIVVLAEIIAYMVNNGFRIVLSTHSLTFVQALNNLILASKLPSSKNYGKKIPDKDIRLDSNKVAAYHFISGEIQSAYMTEQTSLCIDERPLAETSEALSHQLNIIRAYTIYLAS